MSKPDVMATMNENKSIQIPNSVTSLYVNICYTLPILNLQKTLIILAFDWKSAYDMELPNLPNTLLHLELSEKYNKPFLTFPPALETAIFGNIYTQPLPFLPDSIRTLRLGKYYNHSLPNLPESLIKLTLSRYYDHPLPKTKSTKLFELFVSVSEVVYLWDAHPQPVCSECKKDM